MSKEDNNLLSPLGNSLGDLLNSLLDSGTDLVVKGFCKMTVTETSYIREEKYKKELAQLEKQNKIESLQEKINDRKQKELDKIREEKVNDKNIVYINNEKIDFSDLWFNLGMKNKSKDVPILTNYKVTDICMLFVFELPVGITKSDVEEKIEEIATFFETHESNIEIRKHKNFIDLIVVTCDIFDKVYNYDPKMFESNEGLKVPIGFFLNKNYEIKLLTTDFAKSGRHAMLIAGKSGFGKSTLLRLILLHLILNYTPEQLEIIIFSGKGDTDFIFLKDSAPHLYENKVYVDINEIIGDEANPSKNIEGYDGVLESIVKEVQYRNKILSEHDCKDIDEYFKKGYKDLKYKVVVFDEYSYYHSDKKFSKLQSAMGSLVSTARSCGIKIIIALQDAQKEYYSAAIKYNVGCKCLFKAENEAHSKNMCNTSGLENLKRIGEGHFYAASNMPTGRDYVQFKGILPPEDTDKLIKMIKNKYK